MALLNGFIINSFLLCYIEVKWFLLIGNNPSITNLAATVTGTDATPIGTLLFTLTVADADTSDTLTTTMTTTTSLFNFDSTSCEYFFKETLKGWSSMKDKQNKN